MRGHRLCGWLGRPPRKRTLWVGSRPTAGLAKVKGLHALQTAASWTDCPGDAKLVENLIWSSVSCKKESDWNWEWTGALWLQQTPGNPECRDKPCITPSSKGCEICLWICSIIPEWSPADKRFLGLIEWSNPPHPTLNTECQEGRLQVPFLQYGYDPAGDQTQDLRVSGRTLYN